MALVRQSYRTRPPFGELNDPPLPSDCEVLCEEEFVQRSSTKSLKRQKKHEEESFNQIDVKRPLKAASSKELAYADRVERLIIEASLKKQRERRRRSSALSHSNSHHLDKLLEGENSDWFFEKILEKFQSVRSKQTNELERSRSNDSNNGSIYGVERIVERRYYVKKQSSLPKRDQLTSTGDLTQLTGKNKRLLSGDSSITAATSCSRCSSSTPTFVETLRDQSDTLRHDISELRCEIEQLQSSQQEFIEQLQSQLKLRTDSQPTPQKFGNNATIGNRPVIAISGQRSRSISTESQASSASSKTTSSAATTTNRTVTPVPKVIALPAKTPSTTAPPIISEFVANKNPLNLPTPQATPKFGYKPPPSIPQAPPFNPTSTTKPPSIPQAPPFNPTFTSKPPSIPSSTPVNPSLGSKPPSIPSSTPVNPSLGSKPPSVAATPPVNQPLGSKPPSVSSTPSVNSYAGAKLSSMPSLSPVNESISSARGFVKPLPTGFVSSRNSSAAPTPPRAPSPPRMPIYENELAHRRTLSPRSQIVASSGSVRGSSASSTKSHSPTPTQSDFDDIPKVVTSPLHDSDLNDLVQYSSHLSLSGFPPSTTPVITNPNSSSTFWDSVDHYIESSRPTSLLIGLPFTPGSYYENSTGLNQDTTKQLDKYNLEIKPQGAFTPSAPFIMPPSDISP
ncbi:unnamed protein product [Adineta steineri]|uniref:Uncharacterized protein n=1 Tax=Adineta steineri TaxID=433720 RepID=A0A815Q9L5_9BILA|nr:unnamed protein product [Adineta steineri]